MNKAQILKAIETGQSVAFGRRNTYGTPRKVIVLGQEKMPFRSYGGALAPEREWPLRWKVQQVEDEAWGGEVTHHAGEISWAKSQELLGDWSAIEVERTAERERGQAKAAREAAILHAERDVATKIRDLFKAVGSETHINFFSTTIQIRPTDLYDFLERLGKTTARTLAADARDHFAPDLTSDAAAGFYEGFSSGIEAAIDYIEETAK
jgi:hypothetical protein